MRKSVISLIVANFIFVFCGLGIALAEENKPYDYVQVEVREWFSFGDSSWQISFDFLGYKGESELEFQDIDAPITLTTLRIKPGLYWLTLEGSVGVGEIDSGTTVDTDRFAGLVFSESRSDTDGDIKIVEGKVALRIAPWNENSPSYLDVFVGYQYYQEKLHMSNGVQTIPDFGPFSGLSSTYEFTWLSVPIGVRGNLALNQESRPGLYNISLTGSASIGYSSYSGEGVWNLRGDFEQDPSFKHEADGYAGFADFGVVYQPIRYMSIGVGYQLSSFEARDGTDTTFFSDGTQGEADLDEVSSFRHGPYVSISGQF